MDIKEIEVSKIHSNFVNEFELLDALGSGSFGTVYRAKYGTKMYAVKVISKSKLRKIAMASHLGRPGAGGLGRGGCMPMRGRVSIAASQAAANSTRCIHTNTGNSSVGADTNSVGGGLGAGTRKDLTSIGSNLSSSSNNSSSSIPTTSTSTNSPSTPKKSNPIDLVRKEIAIFKKLNHPNIVKLFQVINDDEDDCLYMVYEYCENGTTMKISMDEDTKPLSEETARSYFRQLVLGVEYLHSHGIAHRDIKPENILLSEENVLKIVDLGESELFSGSSDKSSKSVGSPAFFAPELCMPHHGEISTFALDIFAMGVTLFCFLHGGLPFKGNSVLDLYANIREAKPGYSKALPKFAKDLLEKMLEKDPEKRIKLDQIRDHPWTTNNQTQPLIPKDQNTIFLVKDVTAQELSDAYKNINTIFHVVKAISKLKVKASMRALNEKYKGSFMELSKEKQEEE